MIHPKADQAFESYVGVDTATKKMMQAWADYLDNLKAQALSGNVITAKFGS
jgi:hypothetical protein